MKNAKRTSTLILVTTLSLLAACNSDTDDQEVSASPGQWTSHGADHSSSKYAALDQINAANFTDLEIAWRWESADYRVPDDLLYFTGDYRATPLMVNGVVYQATNHGQVAALDPATGEEFWIFDPESYKLGQPNFSPAQTRGIEYWTDGEVERIFIATLGKQLVSIDITTGLPDPDFGDNGIVDLSHNLGRLEFEMRNITHGAPPIVVGNTVVIGSKIYDYIMSNRSPPGHVRGYDARTGEFKWRFNTIPQPGEDFNETWEEGSWRTAGNTNVWSFMAADDELGIVYLPTSTPTNDYWGGKPPIKTLRFAVVPEVASRVNGLLSGEYDFITDLPPDQIKTVESNTGFEVVGGPITNHRLMVFDKNNGPMQNVKIRQAMTHAIDRETIVETLWDGRTSVPAGLQWSYYGDMFLSDWTVPEYDMELARKLVQESGYNGEEITFRVLNNYYTNQVSTAQINAESFRQIGLNVKIEIKENWQQIFDKESGPRMVRDWSNSAPYPDPVSSIVNQHCQNGQQQQVGEWTNEEFNALCIKLETSTDLEERRAAFRRMLEIAEREDPAYTVMHQSAVFFGKRKDIAWNWSGLQSMDFRADNFQVVAPGN